MKKILLSFFMCMLAIIGMQADDKLVYTLTPKSGSNNAYASNCDITINDITWNLTGNSTVQPWRIGGKNLTDVDRELYSKTAMNADVDKVVLTTGTANSVTVNSAKLLVASQADFTGAVEYPFEFVPSSNIEIPVSAVSGSYYKFVFNVTIGSDNKYIQFTEAKFYVTTELPVLADPTFNPAGDAVLAGTEVTISATNDATIMYKVDNADYAEYTNPIVINEACTITAYATKDGFENSNEVTATYTIKVPVYGVEDVLNRAFTGISGTSYDGWADKVGESGTKYLGNSAGGNDAIQLRSSNSNSGIVSDRSVGTVKKVTVKWNSSTTSGRTLDVYGSNTAYDSASRLYEAENQGTKLGSIVCGTSTELVIDGDYEYIGLRSSSGAMYLDEIQIVWYIPENITAGMYYLVPGEWEDENVALYAAEFINKNAKTSEFVQGFLNDHYVYFQLDGEGKYTHMAFYRIANTGNTTTTEITDWDEIDVLDKTPELTYTAPGAGNIMRYNVDESKWEEVEIGTGVNRVELAEGIGYAYGVVSAEGAIEVYNVNGAVVARGNDNVDLRGLGRGVYIIRNGNQVRKVVR